MMPSAIYGMIPTYGDFVMIKCISKSQDQFNPLVFSCNTWRRPLRINSDDKESTTLRSPPAKNAKKLEWPLAEDMRCPNNPYYSAKSLMFGVSTSWGHS
ncbi:hypothetical protein CR513_04725, partial [Mucuna pruriens]